MCNNMSDDIRRNIKKYRIQNKMTQADLAAVLDIDVQYYAQLERGERNFTIEKLVALCQIFKIGIENIIEISPPDREPKEETLKRVSALIGTLSESQLLLAEKIIEDIKAYAK